MEARDEAPQPRGNPTTISGNQHYRRHRAWLARPGHGVSDGVKPEKGNNRMSHKPTINTPPQGRTIAVVGDVYRFMATGEETNGKYALWEAFVPPGGGPPPHVHSREEESFFILEGEITFTINDERVVATAAMF